MNSAINPVQQDTQMDDDIPRYRDLRNDFLLPPSIVSDDDIPRYRDLRNDLLLPPSIVSDDDFNTPKKPTKPHSTNAPKRPSISSHAQPPLSVSRILF